MGDSMRHRPQGTPKETTFITNSISIRHNPCGSDEKARGGLTKTVRTPRAFFVEVPGIEPGSVQASSVLLRV